MTPGVPPQKHFFIFFLFSLLQPLQPLQLPSTSRFNTPFPPSRNAVGKFRFFLRFAPSRAGFDG